MKMYSAAGVFPAADHLSFPLLQLPVVLVIAGHLTLAENVLSLKVLKKHAGDQFNNQRRQALPLGSGSAS